MDCKPTRSSVHGILQARILEWVAVPFPRGSSPNPGMEPGSPALQANSLPTEPPVCVSGGAGCGFLVAQLVKAQCIK